MPQRRLALCDPAPDQRVVGDDDATGPREDPLAPFRRERDSREPIAQGAGRDGGVVVNAPQLLDERRRADDPADPQARQPVGFREAAGDDHPLVTSPRGRRFDAVELRAAIDLVRRSPRHPCERRRDRSRRASSAASRLPVGLFGLQITIARVRGVTSDSSAARSSRQRGRCRSSTGSSGHGRTVAPSARATPADCM